MPTTWPRCARAFATAADAHAAQPEQTYPSLASILQAQSGTSAVAIHVAHVPADPFREMSLEGPDHHGAIHAPDTPAFLSLHATPEQSGAERAAPDALADATLAVPPDADDNDDEAAIIQQHEYDIQTNRAYTVPVPGGFSDPAIMRTPDEAVVDAPPPPSDPAPDTVVDSPRESAQPMASKPSVRFLRGWDTPAALPAATSSVAVQTDAEVDVLMSHVRPEHAVPMTLRERLSSRQSQREQSGALPSKSTNRFLLSRKSNKCVHGLGVQPIIATGWRQCPTVRSSSMTSRRACTSTGAPTHARSPAVDCLAATTSAGSSAHCSCCGNKDQHALPSPMPGRFDLRTKFELWQNRRRDPVPLWRGTIKFIEGHYGTAVAALFVFIRFAISPPYHCSWGIDVV